MKKEEIQSLTRQGEEHYERGEFRQAKACFERILNSLPDHLEALNNMGVIAYQLGDGDTAERYFRRALKLDSRYQDAVENLAKCLEAKGDLMEAAGLYQERRTLGEAGVDVLNSLGNCLLQLNDLNAAREVYEESLQIDGNQEIVKRILEGLEAFSRVQAPSDSSIKAPSLSARQKLKRISAKRNYTIQIISFSDFEKDERRKLRWGDYWFKYELEREFEKLGHTVCSSAPDIIIHLFGIPVKNIPESPYKILWIHSHPDMVSPQILENYDRIYCLSPTFLNKIRQWGFEADLLIGATAKAPVATELRYDIVFVGNTKGPQGRKIIRDLGDTSLKLKIWGEGWENILPPEHYGGLYYENQQLGELYASSKIVLNDHHDDMRREGFLNPRILDVFASGGFVISDDIRGVESIFGDTLIRYKNPQHLRELIEYYVSHSEERKHIIRKGQNIARSLTFSKVAETILNDLDTEIRSVELSPLCPLPHSCSKHREAKPESTNESCFQKLLEGDAWDLNAAYELANQYLRSGNRQNAIFALKKCVAIDPYFEPAVDLLKRLMLEIVSSMEKIADPIYPHTFIHAAWERDPAFPEMTPSVIIAFDIISNHHPEFSLLVYSHKDLGEYPWEILEILACNKRIEFRGFEHGPVEFTKGEIFVYPASTDDFRHRLLIALSSGLPALTTPQLAAGIIRHGHNGLVVRAKEIKSRKKCIAQVEINDLAKKMVFLAKDRALLAEMKSNVLSSQNSLGEATSDGITERAYAVQPRCMEADNPRLAT